MGAEPMESWMDGLALLLQIVVRCIYLPSLLRNSIILFTTIV